MTIGRVIAMTVTVIVVNLLLVLLAERRGRSVRLLHLGIALRLRVWRLVAEQTAVWLRLEVLDLREWVRRRVVH